MCRSNSKLGTLMHSLPQNGSGRVEASLLADKLGLSLPTTDDRQACCFSVLISVRNSKVMSFTFREFHVGALLSPAAPQTTWSLPAIIDRMRSAYCGTLTAELSHLATRYVHQTPSFYFRHCPTAALLALVHRSVHWCSEIASHIDMLLRVMHSAEQAICMRRVCSAKKQWLVQRMENRQPPSRQQQLGILRGLVDADAFEKFLASKFPASKVTAVYHPVLQ